MLEQLLTLLRQGGSHTVTDLAQQLQTTAPMVEAMLQDLARRGYLRPLSANCPGQCATCPFGGECVVAGAQQVWTLTDKARQWVEGR